MFKDHVYLVDKGLFSSYINNVGLELIGKRTESEFNIPLRDPKQRDENACFTNDNVSCSLPAQINTYYFLQGSLMQTTKQAGLAELSGKPGLEPHQPGISAL